MEMRVLTILKIIKNMIKKPIIKALPVSTYKDIKNSKKLRKFVICYCLMQKPVKEYLEEQGIF